MALLSSGSGAAAGGAEWSARESSNSHFARGARPDLQTDGFCVQIRSSTLRLGAAVNHKKFGLGTVVMIEGQGEHARVQVQFEQAGSKWLVLAYANLEPV